MARKKNKQRPIIGRQQGKDLVVLTGIPLEPLANIKNALAKDMSKGDLKFEGAASIQNDWSDLYRQSTLNSIHSIIGSTITKNSSASKPTPRRIMILYVPSRDSNVLVEEFGIACYLEPLESHMAKPQSTNGIAWRHTTTGSLNIIDETLQRAIATTDLLEKAITKEGRSALTLPPQNFYFPDRESTIYETYLSLARHEISIDQIKSDLNPKRFTNEQLPAKALKGDHHRDRFFQDQRGRIFPPDIYHAPSRFAESSEVSYGLHPMEMDREVLSESMRVLHQRYRFGVMARDGNLHYDVQYESPRELYNERMYCASTGSVTVTGTHANVGVNDVIWVPDGVKKPG